jgi:hypothetical protein
MLDLSTLDQYIGDNVDITQEDGEGSAGIVVGVSTEQVHAFHGNGERGRWVSYDWGHAEFVTKTSKVTVLAVRGELAP